MPALGVEVAAAALGKQPEPPQLLSDVAGEHSTIANSGTLRRSREMTRGYS
jgi:hypothetical protein